LVYHFLDSSENRLLYVLKNNAVDDLTDSIYFSFVTATTTGFGDIIPFGYFKIVAVMEVIFGLLLLSVVTYKLVSLKQDIISSEIYEISLNERISRLRSSLSLFRQNLDALISKVDDGTIKKRSIS
ncbi:two pore domain potassium channel family protein, partial [Candidatus Woesearchaeota archaeon]|nr:two pore domain potassium channel family protein [Candidatus Woesearchaeota archaeon]